MKKNNVKLNYIYNLIFQIFAMLTPLITTPYVSRVLSPVGIGQFSFAASINTYFCLAAALGFSFYAQREVAKNQGDIKRQSITFWEIFICKIIIGVSTFFIDWVLIFLGVYGEYTLLMKIMSIEIIGIAFNIAFFFQGNEKFGVIALRDFIIRILGIAAIFILVKKPSDLWIYALSNSLTALLSAGSLWFCLRDKIQKVPKNGINLFRHIGPSVRLFIPTIAISIYTILDKTLIGILIPGTIEVQNASGVLSVERLADVENGYYAQAEKIIKLAMTIIASLGTVMMPRNSKALADGDKTGFRNNVEKAIEFVFFIGAPMWAGLSAISFNFSTWFFGVGYDKVPVLMCIFATMIIPSGLGNILGQQYLIPKGEDKKYSTVYVISAVINLSLNLILIPKFLSFGAAVASVIAEAMAPIIIISLNRSEFNIIRIFRKNIKPLIASAIMFSVVFLTSIFLKSSIVSSIFLILEGILVYTVLIIAMKYQLVMEGFQMLRTLRKDRQQ